MGKIEIDERSLEDMRKGILSVKEEVMKAIVGQEEVITQVIICLLCAGHALIEGVPGLGKTYLVKTLGRALSLDASRIQLTPDLMPTDIIGTDMIFRSESGEGYDIRFRRGPVFTQILLADEINRATPKTQSALLEAMQEGTVTVGGNRYPLERPFMVLATQNPIEMEGTYPLPEAQLDRIFYKIVVPYPIPTEMHRILEITTGTEEPDLSPKLGKEEIITYQAAIKAIPVSAAVRDYAVRMVYATHPPKSQAKRDSWQTHIRYGASPRGAQSLILGGKVLALLDGRIHVSFDDIRAAALPALRHRLILSFEGEAEGVTTDDIIGKILESLPEQE